MVPASSFKPGTANTGACNQGSANTGAYNVGSANTGFCLKGDALTGTGVSGLPGTPDTAQPCKPTCPAGTYAPQEVPVPGTFKPNAQNPALSQTCPDGQTFDIFRPQNVGQKPTPAEYCACLGPNGQPTGFLSFNPLDSSMQSAA
ncbi:hypothetical protein WJX72_010258 [[Myrmecia] bisecta]|uniref:Uncharacterized protein n=1 Tax=[Myrmecia] bisecta TaxID=41462 RepID=A0AAW1P8M6_9CHLO